MDKAMTYLLVGLGSALGGIVRHWINQSAIARFGEAFPWGTLAVNASGSLLIGILSALAAGDNSTKPSPLLLTFLMVGICGGFTTFSAFSLQTLKLLQSGQHTAAFANIALSVAGCLVAAWAGFLLGHSPHR